MTPYHSKPILNQILQLPDHLRTDKILFKKIVISLSPNIPFARHGANALRYSIFYRKDILSYLTSELSRSFANSIIPQDFLKFILKNYHYNDERVHKKILFAKKILKNIIPTKVRNSIRDNIAMKNVEYSDLAFRTFIILKMYEQLNHDKTIIN